MRKALIGLILAATVMTPVAAEAQNWRNRDGNRGERSQNGVDGGEARSERIQQHRQERQAQQAQQAPQQAQQAPQQVQQAPQVQVVQRQRGDGNRGNWRGGGDNGRGNRGGGDSSGANFQGGNNNGDRGNRRGGGGGGNQGSIYPEAWQGNPNDPQLRNYQQLERRNQQRYGNDRRGDGRNWRNDNRGDNNWRGDNRGGRNWNRNWRNDNRYDWQRYRYSNRGFFHLGPYYSPYRGYGYNRFSIGFFLEPLFYNQRYWIGDPWQYRLPPAEPGTAWVRYYNDVLLVDVYTGEVLDTIYDFFW